MNTTNTMRSLRELSFPQQAAVMKNVREKSYAVFGLFGTILVGYDLLIIRSAQARREGRLGRGEKVSCWTRQRKDDIG